MRRKVGAVPLYNSATWGLGLRVKDFGFMKLGHLWRDKWTALSGPLSVYGLGCSGLGCRVYALRGEG